MIKQGKKILRVTGVILLLLALAPASSPAVPRHLTVKLRGVYDAKITLTLYDGIRFASPLAVMPVIKAGEETQFAVPDSLLPGEFMIRFDYRAKGTDTPHPAELQLYLNREDITVNANPLFLRGDSLHLTGDRENTAWWAFTTKSGQLLKQIGVLRQVLEQYDRPASPEWKGVLKAYDMRKQGYNNWIDSLVRKQRDLYVSHLYGFQRLNPENWKATPAARMEELSRNWFKGVDLTDTLVLRSRQLNELMSGFMGLYGARSTTEQLRDSLFTEAGKLAIGKASAGDPRVYGWMVDYFYNGYETYNIVAGMKILEKHLNNPGCLTRKRLAIAKRLEGMKNMVPGVKVRNVMVHDIADREETIGMSSCDKAYRLLVFYDSECDHCRALLAALRTWYAVPAHSARMEVVSVCIDSSRELWVRAFTANAFPWTDRYAPGGINSQAATDYYVLSAPYMFLIDKNGVLVSSPNTLEEMEKGIE